MGKFKKNWLRGNFSWSEKFYEKFFSKSYHEKFLKQKVINEKFPKVSNEKFWEILETVSRIILKDIKGAP